MKLYNTLTREVEEVTPFTKGSSLGLYACGPTVYDYTHLGHLRKYTMDDVLVRALRHPDIGGFDVKFVQNITDVGHLTSDGDTGEDKLEKGAKKYNKTVWEIAKEFEAYFWKSMDAMNVTRPDVSCRATDHIQQQLDMVLELEKKGHTYVIEGDGVYFDTSTFDDYGTMARLNLEEQQEGARIGTVEGKRNPTDFALWKFERPGENRAMVWESPWAKRSFPGWHIECSAMGCHYLGEQFEIHTGGIDHIPVHHTNEIAQAEAAFGKKPFVKYWVHHNFLQVEGEKMSKSLGNFYTIDDILDRGFDPMAFRMLFLTSHYRSEMNFTWKALEGMHTAYERLVQKIVLLLEDDQKDVLNSEANAEKRGLREAFFQEISNDLHTSEAMAVLWEVFKNPVLSSEQKLELVTDFDQILGLNLLDQANKLRESKKAVLPSKVKELAQAREKARADKDWTKSDQLRDQIENAGYSVEDTADGQKIIKK